jgi:hypothetical protein
MLNRLINGTDEISARRLLIALMKDVRDDPSANEDAIEVARYFLESLLT